MLFQFLVEAAALTVAGGLAGLAFGGLVAGGARGLGRRAHRCETLSTVPALGTVRSLKRSQKATGPPPTGRAVLPQRTYTVLPNLQFVIEASE